LGLELQVLKLFRYLVYASFLPTELFKHPYWMVYFHSRHNTAPENFVEANLFNRYISSINRANSQYADINMDTRYLRTLVTVVDTGSFSKAARVLHLTQSAVSQRIKFLEDSLNAKLLNRSEGAVRPTAAGDVVIDSGRRILGIQDALQGRLKQLTQRKRVSLCCTPSFGTAYLPGVMNRFMLESSAEPVDLNIMLQTPGEALEGVYRREFDLAVIEHCPGMDMGMFQTFPLPADELLFVSAPQAQLPTPDLELDDLFQMCLFVRKDGCSSRQLIQQGLEENGKTLNDFSGVVTSDDLRLTCQNVLAGGGVAFMSKSLVREYLENGQMVGHYVKKFPQARCRSIVIDKERGDDPLLQQFARCIFAVMDVPSPF
jgi:DNA-binding transcriptional LysR family regulator